MKEVCKDWGKAILRAAWILLALYYFCWPVKLVGSSMEPTLADGEIVLMSRAAAYLTDYRDGDIVLFPYRDAEGRHTLIKRIIGTAGEEIRILEDGVARDGVLLAEDYAQGKTYGVTDMVIPEGTVYLLGDNREASFDSRNLGVVAKENLAGKVFFRLYPFSGLGRIS